MLHWCDHFDSGFVFETSLTYNGLVGSKACVNSLFDSLHCVISMREKITGEKINP